MARGLAGNVAWAWTLTCALGGCATEIQEGVTNGALRPTEDGGSAGAAENGGNGGVAGSTETKAGAAGKEPGTAGSGNGGAGGTGGGNDGGTAGANAGSGGATGGVAGLPTTGGDGGLGGAAGTAGSGGKGGVGGNGGAGGAPPKTCGATQLALKSALASSNQDDTFLVKNAIDGDQSTRWASAMSEPQWMYVDLGEPAHVSRVVLHWETAYALSYRIELAAAAGGPWKSAYERETGDGGLDDLTQVTAGVARYVRVYGSKRATQYGVSLYEIEVYGDLDETCK